MSEQYWIVNIYISFFQSEMPVGKFCRFPTSRRTVYEAFLYKERFIDFFYRALILSNSSSYGIDSYRTTFELCDYRPQDLVVDGIKSPFIYIKCIKGITGDGKVYAAVAHHLREISYTT